MQMETNDGVSIQEPLENKICGFLNHKDGVLCRSDCGINFAARGWWVNLHRRLFQN